MEYDIERINRLFKGLSPRKISIVSRLSGLNREEIQIMKMKWLEGKSDVQICDTLGLSPSSLTRKRKNGHLKILDALDLYGLSDFNDLPVEDIFDYEGLFYRAQDYLVRFFIRNNRERDALNEVVDYLRKLTEDSYEQL